MIIAITGTPGTGKTTLAKKIADYKGFTYVDVYDLIEEKGLCEEFDKDRDCMVVDVDKVVQEIIKIKKEHPDLVIDSHLSHHIPKKYIDILIVTKCDLKELKKRLEKRGYSPTKVRENLDVEIFDICLQEATQEQHKVIIINTNKKIKVESLGI
ncbi:hypothetical protein CMO92_02100 [Candidatus Woesearchaeota archaeon]|nr:hypothetical protein [Candidatus Woesearchaeota archaeon]